jgi:hypothetical protein
LVAIVTTFEIECALVEIATQDTVAASCRSASCGAAVIVGRIAIITAFETILTVAKIGARDRITASRHGATVGAGIRRLGVAIITGFTRFNLPIAASCLGFTHHHLFAAGHAH